MGFLISLRIYARLAVWLADSLFACLLFLLDHLFSTVKSRFVCYIFQLIAFLHQSSSEILTPLLSSTTFKDLH